MRFAALISMLLVFLMPALGRSASNAQTPPPYIYYYSTNESAFFIELADGTDRTKLADYELPDDHYVVGPGWSPSGNWFAWYSRHPYGETSAAYVVNRWNQTTLTLLDGVTDIQDLVWSPNRDWLLVVRNPTENGIAHMELDVLDVPQNRLLLAYAQEKETDNNIIKAQWHPSGDYVISYENNSSDNPFSFDLNDGQIVILMLDGSSDKYQFYQERGSVIYPLSTWSSDGETVFQSSDHTLALWHNSTVQVILDSTHKIFMQGVVWSPGGNHALIFTTDLRDETTGELWLLRSGELAVERIATGVDITTSRTLDTNIAPRQPQLPLFQHWSSDEQYAAYRAQDGALQIVNIALSTSKSPVLSGTEGRVSSFWWAVDSESVLFQWNASVPATDALYKYSPRTEELNMIVPVLDEHLPYSVNALSPKVKSKNSCKKGGMS